MKDKNDLNKDTNGNEYVQYDNNGIQVIKAIAIKIKRKLSIGKAEYITNCVTVRKDKKRKRKEI